MGSVVKKVMFVGRATVFMVGLAMILALTVGGAGAAFGANGANFILGQTNAATAITKLAGAAGVAGPSLQIDNNSTNAAATALDLQVEAGKVPMTVNSSVKVANLNSDMLDNLDSRAFVRSTYTKILSTTGDPTSDNQQFEFIFCDGDDFALSGGYSQVDAGTVISSSGPAFIQNDTDGWAVRWRNDATTDTISVMVVCADVGTPRQ